jgi:hypothetical protein
MALVAACLILVVLQAYRQNTTGLNPHLLLALALGALLLPSFSHDYRLTILTVPAIVLLLAEVPEDGADQRLRRILWASAILTLSFTYSSTLFPFVMKPAILANNSPALLVSLLAVTILALLRRPASRNPST